MGLESGRLSFTRLLVEGEPPASAEEALEALRGTAFTESATPGGQEQEAGIGSGTLLLGAGIVGAGALAYYMSGGESGSIRMTRGAGLRRHETRGDHG